MLTPDDVADIKAALALAQADIPGWTHSTYLKMADRATHTVYSTVAQVLNVAGFELEGIKRDVTSHTSGGWQQKISVLKNGGKLVFLVHFDKAETTLGAAGLAGAALEQTLEYFKITYPDGSGYQFTAFVGLGFDAPVNSRLMGKITLDITGTVSVI